VSAEHEQEAATGEGSEPEFRAASAPRHAGRQPRHPKRRLQVKREIAAQPALRRAAVTATRHPGQQEGSRHAVPTATAGLFT
jgi:hypothetical protein